MAGPDSEWALDRLPDGTVRRRDEPAAAATLASHVLLAAAMKAAAAFSAAQLAADQRADARELADRNTVAASEVAVQAEIAAELARQEVAAQEDAAAEVLVAGEEAALHEVEAAEESASADLLESQARLTDSTDVESSRILAAEELAAARDSASRRLADARHQADDQLAAAVRLAATQVAAAEEGTRESQAKQLVGVQADAAEELAGVQSDAAEELAGVQSHAAEELAGVQSHAAEELAIALADVEEELALAVYAAAAGLAKTAEQFRQVMDWAGVAGCTVSNDGRFLRVNRSMCTLLGRSEEELLGAALTDVIHPDDVGIVGAQLRDLLAGQRSSFRSLSRYLAPDGRVIWGDLSVAAVPNADDTASFHIAQIVDLTARVDYEAVLESLAAHDELTGLASRAAMLIEVDRALSSQRRSGRAAAVLVMDLDRFKNVNTSLGHAAGDDLLKATATRIANVLRGGDLAARPGGDEFVVVLCDLEDPVDAVRTAWRLVEAFRHPVLIDGVELFATASIGVAINTDAERAVEAGDLLREAETAMYVAKAEGRDRVSVYDEELQAIVSDRLAVEVHLRNALERDQLAVWYQPEVDLATGAVIAFEALLRWHHPDGSVWTADRFIDVAEDTGLILGIGDWVLRQACTQAAAWATARPDRPIIVRVNMSALQIAHAGLLPTLDDALATSGLNPALLCIEITETALLRQTVTTSENLAGIHARGVSVAIDDFGTGYACLLYLRRYPIDVIKIDRSFVTDITTDKHARAIIVAVVALGRGLGVTVTAEGVEHPDQATILRDIGCPSAQGWLYSKAVPAGQATDLLDHVYPVLQPPAIV